MPDFLRRYVQTVDAISEYTGRLAGWMFFMVGIIVTYEVFVRYVLISPTVWVDEISRIVQVWATYLAIAYVLKHREHIVIDLTFRDVRSLQRRIVETFALLVIVFFGAIAAKFGWDIWWKSTVANHTTDTYLAVPLVFIQSSIWVGFGLIALQALAEMIKIWTGEANLQRSELGRH